MWTFTVRDSLSPSSSLDTPRPFNHIVEVIYKYPNMCSCEQLIFRSLNLFCKKSLFFFFALTIKWSRRFMSAGEQDLLQYFFSSLQIASQHFDHKVELNHCIVVGRGFMFTWVEIVGRVFIERLFFQTPGNSRNGGGVKLRPNALAPP